MKVHGVPMLDVAVPAVALLEGQVEIACPAEYSYPNHAAALTMGDYACYRNSRL